MLSALIALVAAVIALFGAVLWQSELVMLLPFLATLNGLQLPLGGVLVRVDQLLASLLAVPLLAALVAGRRRLRVDSTAYWLAALLATNVIASVLNSPTRTYSLMQCLNLASAWIIYLLVINFVETRAELDRAFSRSIWAAIITTTLGVGAFALASAGLDVGGAEVSRSAAEHLANAYGAYGTMVEPNLFGAFAAAFLVLAICLLAVPASAASGTISRRLLRTVAVMSSVALLLSFTRAAWIGTMVGVACVVLFGRRTLGIRAARVGKPVAIGVGLALVLLLLPGITGDFLRFKLVNLVNLESRTATLRLLTSALALQQTLDHPIIGYGTFTFAPLIAQGSDFAQYTGWRGLWIGNYLLLALHDTGIIGLALWCGLIWSILARAIRATRTLSATDPESAARTFAMTCAVITLLVSFLATTGFSLGYPWLLIGLLSAHCHGAMAPAPVPVPSAHPGMPGLLEGLRSADAT